MDARPGLHHLDSPNGDQGTWGAGQDLGVQREVTEDVLGPSWDVVVEVVRGEGSGGERMGRARRAGWTPELGLLLGSENKTESGKGTYWACGEAKTIGERIGDCL